MYNAVAGSCAEQAANAGAGGGGALSATVTDPSDPVFVVFVPAASSNPGDIASTVTVSGGTAPYTFFWKLRELSDPDNILAPTQGTATNQTYNDSTITTTYNPAAFPPPPPPAPGTYEVECQVTDSATPAAVVTVQSNPFTVEVV